MRAHLWAPTAAGRRVCSGAQTCAWRCERALPHDAVRVMNWDVRCQRPRSHVRGLPAVVIALGLVLSGPRGLPGLPGSCCPAVVALGLPRSCCTDVVVLGRWAVRRVRVAGFAVLDLASHCSWYWLTLLLALMCRLRARATKHSRGSVCVCLAVLGPACAP